MNWLDYLWPFGDRRRERMAREQEVEKSFKRQLEEAQKRQGDIQDIVEKLKKEQEDRRQAERNRRRTFPSFPTMTTSQGSGT